MSRRHNRRRPRLSDASGDQSLTTILGILADQSLSAWLDPAWTPGTTIADDSGTERMTALQSRPIAGQSQYTISQGSLPLAPATASSPTGKRVLTFAGAQYLIGAATLAAQFQGSAPFTAVSLASRADGSTRMRWAMCYSGGTDNRISEYISASGPADARLRTQAGSTAGTSGGSVVAISTPRVFSTTYSGSAYSTWVHGVASVVGEANTRAPATLDELILGAQRGGGTIGSFWSGMHAGVAICAGVLSAPTRQALESAFGAYYGYPI